MLLINLIKNAKTCDMHLKYTNPNLINFRNTNLFYTILKPRFLEPEIKVGI